MRLSTTINNNEYWYFYIVYENVFTVNVTYYNAIFSSTVKYTFKLYQFQSSIHKKDRIDGCIKILIDRYPIIAEEVIPIKYNSIVITLSYTFQRNLENQV